MRLTLAFLVVLLVSSGSAAQSKKQQQDFAKDVFNELKSDDLSEFSTLYTDSALIELMIASREASNKEKSGEALPQNCFEEWSKSRLLFNQSLVNLKKRLNRIDSNWREERITKIEILDAGKESLHYYLNTLHFVVKDLRFEVSFATVYDHVRNKYFIAGDEISNIQRRNYKNLNDPNKVFLSVVRGPQFSGGDDKMNEFIAQNIEYPRIARQSNIKGKVIVEFMVNSDGSLSDYNVVKEIGGGCGAAVIRVLKRMPKWEPAKRNGKAVPATSEVVCSFQNN